MREPITRWPSYVTLWRWHFYAGLFCLPFVLWLSLTGSIYLFRPQIEALLDRPYAHVTGPGPAASAAAQAAAAVRAVPGSVLHRYQLPDTREQAVQVIVGQGEREVRVYVHPQTLAVLKIQDEDSRPMRVVFRLHGELLAGDPGSWLVELAASWTIVMIVTGLALWWPRGHGMAGVVYPRLRARGRRFWRDLHGVAGFWVSAMALFLLLSGLPWAKSWGAYLRTVRSAVEGAPVKQDWSGGHRAELRARAAADAGTRAMLGEHAEHEGMTMAHPVASYAALDRVVGAIWPLGLAAPVLVAPPTGMGAPWTAKSDAADRPQRTDLTLDGASGAILSRKDFAGRRLIDRVVGWGVAIHEGQAFGVANQLLNLFTATGLVLLTVSGTVMWWRRRPDGMLGAPGGVHSRATGWAVAVPIVALGVLLPLFGASLIVVLVTERLVLRRVAGAARWLGLAHAAG
jgi:uncharacterized iron-regulated membrane protein